MRRSGTFLVVAHCLLNANAKVKGLAPFRGAMNEVILPFLEIGAGLLQLPCPECTFLGMCRWGMTAEQYDVPAFRAHGRKLLKPVVYQIEDALATGYKVLGVLGVEGSPSCGVDWTCRGYQGGSCGEGEHRASKSSGSGVYMNIFRGMLQDRGVSLPFVGVDEERPDMKALMNLLP